MPTPESALERLLVALLIGALIGLDRERSEARKAHQLFAGVRTFPLIALCGALATLAIDITGPVLVIASFLTVSAIALASYLRTSATGDVGATTEMAALATFLLGVMAGAGQLVVAGAVGVSIAVLLVAKPRLEAFSHALSSEELAATLELAVISVIVLPLLPREGYGPWQVLNPFNVWLMVVLVSGLSFVGFIATRLWGERQGLAIAGVVGALVSSTAVTVAMASHSRTNPSLAASAASAAVLASTIMGLRVAILAGVISVNILPLLLPVIAVMTVAGLLAAWLLSRQTATLATQPSDAQLSNPFSLSTALSFAFIYALILLGVRAAQEFFGARGMYVVAALSAVADVDAITLATVRLGSETGQWRVAAIAIVIAVVSNTLVKLGISLVAGAGRFRWYTAMTLGVMAGIGMAVGVLFFS